MNALFVCENDRLFSVYNEAVVGAIAARVTLDRHVYTRAELLAAPETARSADFLFSTWGMPAFGAEEIASLFPRLRAVFYAAGSVQGFAKPFLESGVEVFSAWAANAVPVAELAVSEILLANKGFYQATRKFGDGGHAAASEYCRSFPGSYDTPVGLIGVGMVGAETAKLLRHYRLRVLAYDPFLSDERAAALGVTKTDLATLFAECQTVSNHLANNAQTVGMLNYELFRRMRPNAAFINTGRGAQVVEADLVRALEEEPGRTAVLDVTFPEPPEAGHPFYRLPNVFLTPHIAGSMGVEVARMSEYMREELEAVLDLRGTRYSVSLEMLKTMA